MIIRAIVWANYNNRKNRGWEDKNYSVDRGRTGQMLMICVHDAFKNIIYFKKRTDSTELLYYFIWTNLKHIQKFWISLCDCHILSVNVLLMISDLDHLFAQ